MRRHHASHFSTPESTRELEAAQQGREFVSVEELLRHDAAQTNPSAKLLERLQKSVAAIPKPSRSWFRWFKS